MITRARMRARIAAWRTPWYRHTPKHSWPPPLNLTPRRTYPQSDGWIYEEPPRPIEIDLILRPFNGDRHYEVAQ